MRVARARELVAEGDQATAAARIGSDTHHGDGATVSQHQLREFRHRRIRRKHACGGSTSTLQEDAHQQFSGVFRPISASVHLREACQGRHLPTM